MNINDRMAALADTDAFRALVQKAMVEGAQELDEAATMLLAGVLCVDCRVRLRVATVPGLPGMVNVELLHDTKCPTWLSLIRARRASEN
jgi:hypothetical protein